jgi:chromosome segregation ATPase
METGWTIDTLKEHLDALIGTNDRRYEQRFAAQDQAVTAALAAQEKAVAAALAAQEKATAAAFASSERAIDKAENAQTEYNVRSNEFRGQLDDQAKLLLPRSEFDRSLADVVGKVEQLRSSFDERLEAQRRIYDEKIAGLGKEIAGLRESRSEGSGRGAGLNAGWGYLVGLVVLAGAIIAIAARFLG